MWRVEVCSRFGHVRRIGDRSIRCDLAHRLHELNAEQRAVVSKQDTHRVELSQSPGAQLGPCVRTMTHTVSAR